MTSDTDEEQQEQASGKKSRSPAYPFITLEKAIFRAKQVFAKENKHEAPLSALASHWNFSPTSSGAKQTLAALRQFGLLSVTEGTGSDRKAKLTEAGRRIALETREDELIKLLQAAAVAPKLYKSLWEKWGAELPSEQAMSAYLTVEREFNPGVVGSVIRDFKATLEYAKMGAAGSPATDEVDEEGEDANDEETPLQDLEKPPPGHKPQKIQQDSFGKEYLRVGLTGDRMVRVLFDGPPPTQSEIDKLIKLLELTRDQYPPS